MTALGKRAVLSLELEENVLAGDGNFRVNGRVKNVVEIVFKINTRVTVSRNQDRPVEEWKAADIFRERPFCFLVTGLDLVRKENRHG